MSFLKPQVIFHDRAPLNIFSSIKSPISYNIFSSLHTFYKSSLSKLKFSDLPLLALKFTKFLMSFLEPRVSFSSNFTSLFSFMRLTLLTLFHVNLYMLWTKGSDQRANFQTFDSDFFQAANQLSFKFCTNLQFHDT